jgi:hypothetical protein
MVGVGLRFEGLILRTMYRCVLLPPHDREVDRIFLLFRLDPKFKIMILVGHMDCALQTQPDPPA